MSANLSSLNSPSNPCHPALVNTSETLALGCIFLYASNKASFTFSGNLVKEVVNAVLTRVVTGSITNLLIPERSPSLPTPLRILAPDSSDTTSTLV